MFAKCETSDALNNALHVKFFGSSKLSDKHNLVTSWKIDTSNGDEYMEKHGLAAVQEALAAYRASNLESCSLVSDRMRMVDGITIADEFDNTLLDHCCKSLTVRHLTTAVANNILTSDALTYALYSSPPPRTTTAPVDVESVSAVDLDGDNNKSKQRASKKRKT